MIVREGARMALSGPVTLANVAAVLEEGRRHLEDPPVSLVVLVQGFFAREPAPPGGRAAGAIRTRPGDTGPGFLQLTSCGVETKACRPPPGRGVIRDPVTPERCAQPADLVVAREPHLTARGFRDGHAVVSRRGRRPVIQWVPRPAERDVAKPPRERDQV